MSAWNGHVYTLLHLKWVTNKDLLCSTGNSAPGYVAAWMGGGFEGEWVHVHIQLSPFTVHLNHHNIVNRLSDQISCSVVSDSL